MLWLDSKTTRQDSEIDNHPVRDRMKASLLLEILGKSPGSLVMQQFLGEVGERPQIEIQDGVSYHCFRKSGLALRCNTDASSINGVSVHTGLSAGFDAYRGQLPGGVMLSDGRKDIRRKLGTPARSGTRNPLLKAPPSMLQEEWELFVSTEHQTAAIQWDLYIHGRYAFYFEFDGSRKGRLTLARLTLHRPP